MPNFDKTGPDGKGPKTGLGRGSCANRSSDASTAPGRGLGRGKGMRCCGLKKTIKNNA